MVVVVELLEVLLLKAHQLDRVIIHLDGLLFELTEVVILSSSYPNCEQNCKNYAQDVDEHYENTKLVFPNP